MGCEQSKVHVKTAGVKVKVLFLGTSGSGKSTIFHQIRTGHGIHSTDLSFETNVIRGNLLEALFQLERLLPNYGLQLRRENKYLVDELRPVMLLCKNSTRGKRGQSKVIRIEQSLEESVIKLYEDPALKYLCEQFYLQPWLMMNNNYYRHLVEKMNYLKKIERVLSDDYVPSKKDLLYMYKQTNAVEQFKIQTRFRSSLGNLRNVDVDILDVGGSVHMQSYWSRLAEDLCIAIYTFDTSTFNCFDEDEVNMLQDQLNLIESVFQSECFQPRGFVIALTKVDILEHKLINHSVTDTFPSYEGPNTIDGVCMYIEDCIFLLAEQLCPTCNLKIIRMDATEGKAMGLVETAINRMEIA